MRNTSTPASNSARIISGVLEAGPRVARIFVLRRRRIENRYLIGKRLGPVGLLAGIHFKKAAPVEAALGAVAAAHRLEALVGGDAEIGLAFPGAGGAVAGIKIIDSVPAAGRSRSAAQARGADGPPAFAGPVGAVETADGDAHRQAGLVADIEGGHAPGPQTGAGQEPRSQPGCRVVRRIVDSGLARNGSARQRREPYAGCMRDDSLL